MTNQRHEPPVRVYSHLTSQEEAAYRMAIHERDPALSPARQAQLYELYLNGMSCTEISRYAKGGARLGLVVKACVEGDWYNKYQTYTEHLLRTVTGRVRQVQSEAVNFAADCLAVAHKQHGLAMKKYLETGDPSDLGEFSLKNLSQYRTMVELLLKLTGQDRAKPLNSLPPPPEKAVEGRQGSETLEGEVVPEGRSLPMPGPMELLMSGPPTPEMAAALIRGLHNGPAK